MKAYPHIPALLSLLLFLNCAYSSGFYRYHAAPDSPSVERIDRHTSTIRSVYCDITISWITPQRLEKIIHDFGIKPEISQPGGLFIPDLNFFVISVKNTWNRPFYLKDGSSIYGKHIEKMLSADTHQIMYRGYGVDFKKLFSQRRLLSAEPPDGSTDLAASTIPYNAGFILPDDTIIRIAAFKRHQTPDKRYKINFTVSLAGVEKIIAFDMAEYEYRVDGDFFTLPENSIYK